MTDVGASPIDEAAFANLVDMTGGDLPFVDELVDTYLDEGGILVDRLRTAVATGSNEDLMRAAHSLKSSSLNLGALDLGERCRALEAKAREGDLTDPQNHVERIAAAFEDVRAALLAEREGRAGAEREGRAQAEPSSAVDERLLGEG